MDRENCCPKCGAPLSGDAPEGLCPGCLLKAVAATPDKSEVTLAAARIEGPGTTIGRYELLDLLGEGGMGLVYLAEQKEPVRRKVALKIIKPGMDSRQVVARFEAERQALALLDHPNIAHVFDAGCTETGRPYFVMEHVRGLPITSYCDQNKLTIEQRLRLFEQVCEAVHHAHQKGIIHRDLKPSNILVSVHGDRATPKIIDFGIAKAITSPLTDKTFVTYQGQLLGTPEYMSPEQVDLATQDIDTRSDIYSLGIVLYELLAGVLPFESESFAKAGLAEIQQTIREQEPTSPSIRLTNLGEKAHAIAASRGTQVVPLARRLHRELEWIPLKAMRKDRCRRYKSASEMADDIRDYLNGNPLLAGPETTIYRVQKFVRKHAGSVATVALVAVAVVLGLGLSTTMYIRAEDAHQKEASAREVAEQARLRAEQAEGAAKNKAEELRRSLYINSIQLADAEYREGNIRRARGVLNACPNDLRGWEWSYLWHGLDKSVVTLRGHQGAVTCVAISADGGRIASAGRGDRTIKVWDAATGAELITIPGHEGDICSVAFSPDGSHIVSASHDKTVKVWDAANGRQVKTLTGHQHYTYSARYSPDGKRIVSSSHDGTIKVWDSATGAELMSVNAYREAASSARFTPDGRRIIAAGGWDGRIKTWDGVTGAEIKAFQHDTAGVWTLALSPDGARVVSGGQDGIVKVWDTTEGKELLVLRGHREEIYSLAFSADGKRIASASEDNTIRIWDAKTGAEQVVLRGHEGAVLGVVFSPDNKHVVSCGVDNTVRIWDSTSEAENTTINTRYAVGDLAFSRDSRRLLTAGDNTVTVWDAATGAEVTTLHVYDVSPYQGTPRFGAISPDGERLLCWTQSWGRGGKPIVNVWDMVRQTRLTTLRGHEKPVVRVSFSPDGRYIVTGSADKAIKLWDGAAGAELMALQEHKESLNCVAFSPDSKHFVTGGIDGIMKLRDTTTGAELRTIQHGDGIVSPGRSHWTVVFSPDGKRIVSGGFNDKVKVWDAATGAELMSLDVGEGGAGSVAFSPDGKRLAACGGNKALVRIWNAETGDELITLRLHGAPWGAGCFSPDGKTFAVPHGTVGTTVTLFESVAPPGGYELWRTTEAARKAVDELHAKYGSYREAANALRDDKTLDESVRKAALQIVDARKGDDAFELYRESRAALNSQKSDPNTYRIALEKAEQASRLEPNNLGILDVLYLAQLRVRAYQDMLKTCTKADSLDANNPVTLGRLGGVQYHLGAYDDALKTLTKACFLDPNQPATLIGVIQYRKGAYEEALRTLIAVKRQLPGTLAFMAMSLHQLGRPDEAKATLEQLRGLLKDERFTEDAEAKGLLAEAEGVVLGQK